MLDDCAKRARQHSEHLQVVELHHECRISRTCKGQSLQMMALREMLTSLEHSSVPPTKLGLVIHGSLLKVGDGSRMEEEAKHGCKQQDE